jgi:hypothetical protein
MAVGSYGNIASNVTANSPTKTPLIDNVSTTANVETSLALPDGTKDIVIRARGQSVIKLAFILGNSSVTYFTVPKGNSFTLDGPYDGQTIYFQTDTNDIVEVLRHT